MSAEMVPFSGIHKRIQVNCTPAKISSCSIEISNAVSQRMADAAIWEGRSVPEFVLAMLNAAFPDQAGAA